jgi:hypothetical protein
LIQDPRQLPTRLDETNHAVATALRTRTLPHKLFGFISIVRDKIAEFERSGIEREPMV